MAPKSTDEQRYVRFGNALRTAMAAAGVTQEELAAKLGKKSQGGISDWINGKGAPRTDVVFQIEKALGPNVKPGALSKHLGYLPVNAAKVTADVEAAINGDPSLDNDQRGILLSTYRTFLKMRLPAKPRRA